MKRKGGSMKRHANYLKYVLRHKWFVLVSAIRIGAPFWGAIVHDLSKFRPSEWGPYARTFYAPDGTKQYNETEEFNRAWNDHQKRNRHHWQYWLLTFDRGETIALPMPKHYILEMVADWMGSGRAITGKWEVLEWYRKNRETMTLHPETRFQVESILGFTR